MADGRSPGEGGDARSEPGMTGGAVGMIWADGSISPTERIPSDGSDGKLPRVGPLMETVRLRMEKVCPQMARVRFFLGDPLHESSIYALWCRRSPPFFHTWTQRVGTLSKISQTFSTRGRAFLQKRQTFSMGKRPFPNTIVPQTDRPQTRPHICKTARLFSFGTTPSPPPARRPLFSGHLPTSTHLPDQSDNHHRDVTKDVFCKQFIVSDLCILTYVNGHRLKCVRY